MFTLALLLLLTIHIIFYSNVSRDSEFYNKYKTETSISIPTSTYDMIIS